MQVAFKGQQLGESAGDARAVRLGVGSGKALLQCPGSLAGSLGRGWAPTAGRAVGPGGR